MRKILKIFVVLCSVGAAVTVYAALSGIFDGASLDKTLFLVIASVFSVAVGVLCSACSRLLDRVSNLEDYLGIYVDKGYESEEDEQKTECPNCRKIISSDFNICPYCGKSVSDMTPQAERPLSTDPLFKTEDESYNGTDYSAEEPVSANFDAEDGVVSD